MFTLGRRSQLTVRRPAEMLLLFARPGGRPRCSCSSHDVRASEDQRSAALSQGGRHSSRQTKTPATGGRKPRGSGRLASAQTPTIRPWRQHGTQRAAAMVHTETTPGPTLVNETVALVISTIAAQTLTGEKTMQSQRRSQLRIAPTAVHPRMAAPQQTAQGRRSQRPANRVGTVRRRA